VTNFWLLLCVRQREHWEDRSSTCQALKEAHIHEKKRWVSLLMRMSVLRLRVRMNTTPWLLTMMWHSHQVWVCNSANIPNAATTHGSPISEAHIISPLSMMVHKQCTAPKLTWSLATDVTNNEKAPRTLPLGDHGCLPGPSHHPDPPPNSHLPPPHLNWGKPISLGNFSLRNPIVPPVHPSQSTLLTVSWMVTPTPLLSPRRNQKSDPVFLVLAECNLVTLPVLSCPEPQTQRSPSNQTSLSQTMTLMTECLMTHPMLQLHQVKHSTNESVIITIMASLLQNRSLTLSNICLALYYYLS